mmetsp:Transcript_23013/g.52707  ORF Transcript_23013/g.52707 Transcript_23013/m.52707 type:complete len:472 (-) Transcript_23013:80-1495(-)
MATKAKADAHHPDTFSFADFPPLLGLWKSRLPLIVLPVLAGLRRLPHEARGGLTEVWPGGRCWEFLLLVATAVSTGYLRLPFSVTWWLVLLLAFALETEFLLGVAACLSLTVLLGWYGVRFYHPQAVSALWGGTRRSGSNRGAQPTNGTSKSARTQACWQAWDLCVHGLPAAMVLYWHGPSASWDGRVSSGTVTPAAVAAALPLNVFWLWGLGVGLPRAKGGAWLSGLRLWPANMKLTDTNLVYCVAPALPRSAWLWIYGSHGIACGLWVTCLLLPRPLLVAYAIFIGTGLAKLPYTQAWWMVFLCSLCTYGSPSWSFLQGMCACCGITTAAGFYGTQILAPYAFWSLVEVWALQPCERYAPAWLSRRLRAVSGTAAFPYLARAGDTALHLVPTMTALYLFYSKVTCGAALAALPSNLAYMLATGSTRFAECNQVYGVKPELPNYVWWYIFVVHWAICSGAICLAAAYGAW